MVEFLLFIIACEVAPWFFQLVVTLVLFAVSLVAIVLAVVLAINLAYFVGGQLAEVSNLTIHLSTSALFVLSFCFVANSYDRRLGKKITDAAEGA